MAIDYTTPAIKPPSAVDVFTGMEPETPQQPVSGELVFSAGDGPAPSTGGTGKTQNAQLSLSGEGSSLADMFNQFAMNQLNNPNVYSSDFVQQGLNLIQAGSEARRKDAQAQLEEQMSSRGLTGSDIETHETGRLLSDLNLQRQQQEFDLLDRISQAEAQGRAQAGQIAFQAMSAAQNQEQLDIMRDQLAQEESQFARSLGLEEDKFTESRRQFNESIADRERDRLHEIGLQESDHEFKALQAGYDRSLQLQLQNMVNSGLLKRTELQINAESAWRKADRALQEKLAALQRDLVRQGWRHESAMAEANRQLERELSAEAQKTARFGIQTGAATDIYKTLTGAAAAAGETPPDWEQWFTDYQNWWNTTYGGGTP